MQSIFRSKGARVFRFGLVALMVGSMVWACGGGGNNETTQLQANPTTNWELITAGDIAQCDLSLPSKTAAEKTAQLVERQLASAGANSNVLTLGDNAYLLSLAIGYASCYKPTWGRFLAKTFATPGNHDYEVSGGDNYYDYFGPAAGPTRSGYYRIDQSGWTVFSLNSNIDATAASEQAQWLKLQLATAQPCVAAAWHHPVFTSAPRGDNPKMAAIWEILDIAKADVVLQGHEHHYERLAPLTSAGMPSATGGMRSFVVGTGGADIYPHSTVRAGSEKREVAYGVMRLSLSAGSSKWKFIDVNDTVLDQGEFTCRKK